MMKVPDGPLKRLQDAHRACMLAEAHRGEMIALILELLECDPRDSINIETGEVVKWDSSSLTPTP